MGERYAPVFRMRFEDDLGEAEIAKALGLTVGNVKIRTHRARRHLQATVAPLLAA
jgi:DNA-directed RNA polymerase specialized sigma24 family protein